MPTTIAEPVPGTAWTVEVTVTAGEINNLTKGNEVYVRYWENNGPKPDAPLTGTFQAISDLERYGISSKRVFGRLTGDHLTRHAQLIVTPIPPPPQKIKKSGRKSKDEKNRPTHLVTMYIAR